MSEFKYNEEAWEQIFIDYHVLEEINKKGFLKSLLKKLINIGKLD